ncbi:hypothetical protein MMC22_011584 [Lobaria immixta]|nr:hypothetical protein [Lobaria immixta]
MLPPSRTTTTTIASSSTTTTSTFLALLSASSFSILGWSLVGTLEQRRGELFALAAFLAALPAAFPLLVPASEERGEFEKEEGRGRDWGLWCKGGFPLVAAAVGAWAMLGGG